MYTMQAPVREPRLKQRDDGDKENLKSSRKKVKIELSLE
jgi:hypothetical protein